MKRLVILICVIYIASLTACSDSNKDSDSEKTVTALAAYMAAISKIWEKKTIADLSGPFLHLCDSYAGKEPSCSNCPGTNPEFAFFVKRGDPTKLMVFFMGGGACWSITNCVYNHTYSEDLFESVMLLGLVSSGAGKAGAQAASLTPQIPTTRSGTGPSSTFPTAPATWVRDRRTKTTWTITVPSRYRM